MEPMTLLDNAASALPIASNQPDATGRQRPKEQPKERCRTNSRRGLSNPERRSYLPVASVRRALEVLRTVNRLRIASITEIHAATGLPKPTIVRMLETLMADGYVARDNMFGGYRVTCRVHELTKGYGGISMVIEASRAPAIELTRRIKWPIGIGVLDGDAISIQFWTGAISPWAHTNTVLGLRPTLLSSAMGRSYVAFCPDGEREKLLASIRETNKEFTPQKEQEFRSLLCRIRSDGFAVRDPQTEPKHMTTIAVPLMFEGKVLAAMSVSFYKSAVPLQNIAPQIVAPLQETRAKIEENLSLLMRDARRTVLPGTEEANGLAPLTPG